MNDFAGSYLGFTFDEVHSSELGLVRTSDGSRYNNNLLPEIQDKTTQAIGADGAYYFGSYYTKRNFSLSIAFDGLTDTQIRRIKQLFGDKNLHKLILDEEPYKYYWVKSSSSPVLKALAFDVYDEQINAITRKEDLYGTVGDDYYEGAARSTVVGRLFKGEGTLNFVAYYPFGYSVFKFINQYAVSNTPAWGNFMYYPTAQDNTLEWVESTNLLLSTHTETIDSVEYVIDEPNSTNNNVLFYNPGDFSTPFKYRLIYGGQSSTITIPALTISYGTEKTLTTSSFQLDTGDYGVQWNTKLHLLEGLDENGELTGKVYNKYITSGDFFKLPTTQTCQLLEIEVSNGSLSDFTASLIYDYLYY